MHLPRILFNPSARVYNLRLLLLFAVLVVVSTVALDFYTFNDYPFGSYPLVSVRILSVSIAVHHILARVHHPLFRWPIPGFAVFDLAAMLIELGYLSYCSILQLRMLIFFGGHGFSYSVVHILWIVPLLLLPIFLAAAAVFRVATMFRTKERLYRQRFVFLGSCETCCPAYNPVSILLNRSLTRPLVRGESKIIIFTRAILISCIGIGIPAFAIYSLVVVPARTQAYTKIIPMPQDVSNVWQLAPGDFDGGNATLYLISLQSDAEPSAEMNRSLLATGTVRGGSHGPLGSRTSDSFMQCSISWRDFTNISVSVTLPPEALGVWVYILPCFPSLPSPNSQSVESEFAFPLLAGSHLFAVLSWTTRSLIGSPAWRFDPQILALQQTTTVTSNVAHLTLVQSPSLPTTYMQDVSDASLISGISNIGGFWTFVNGAFALLFGANIIYFAFGRRPLSALGVVHLFQRRSLQRRWHEDFPALHTEGGLPGSESAGIVAFIRERLVDVGDHTPPDESGETAAEGTVQAGLTRGELTSTKSYESLERESMSSEDEKPTGRGYVFREVVL